MNHQVPFCNQGKKTISSSSAPTGEPFGGAPDERKNCCAPTQQSNMQQQMLLSRPSLSVPFVSQEQRRIDKQQHQTHMHLPPPFILSGWFPPRGAGGVAPQICAIVSQCKSASAPCTNFLWRLWRLVIPMLSGPRDRYPPGGGGGCKRGGGGGSCLPGARISLPTRGHTPFRSVKHQIMEQQNLLNSTNSL